MTVARSRSKLTRAADGWALSEVVLDHTPISGVAAVLDVSWDTAHTSVAEVGRQVLIQHPGRLDCVKVVGVDDQAEAVPDAVAVMAPFHVVALAGDKLNTTCQRVQRELTDERGRRGDPLYKAGRSLRTGRDLLTDRQKPVWRPCSPTTTSPPSRSPGWSTKTSSTPTALRIAAREDNSSAE